MERVHAAVHQRRCPDRPDVCRRPSPSSELPVEQPGARRGGAEPGRLLRGRWAQPPGHRSRSRGQPVDPHDQRRLPVPLYRPAVPGQPPDLAARSSPDSAARSGCPRRARDEDDADESARARRLQVRSDVHARYLGLQTSYQAIGVQAANREAARDQLRLAQDRYRLGARHVARGVRRPERGAARRGRLRERRLRLPQGHHGAGSRGGSSPSLTRNAHVPRDEDRSDRRGPHRSSRVAVARLPINKKKHAGTEVRLETVARRDLVSAVTASGKIEAKTTVDVSADITGRIIKIAVTRGRPGQEGPVPDPDRSGTVPGGGGAGAGCRRLHRGHADAGARQPRPGEASVEPRAAAHPARART